MKARKIIIPETAPPKKRLSRSFANPPLVNGKNYFTGSLLGSGSGGSTGMKISTQQEWEQAWAIMGQPAPGKLPPGACAEFNKFSGHKARTTLSLMSIERSGSKVHMRWHITYTPIPEGGTEAFSVIVLPKNASVSASYEYRNIRSAEAIKADAAEKAAKRRAEESRKFSPTLKRPLPLPKSIFPRKP